MGRVSEFYYAEFLLGKVLSPEQIKYNYDISQTCFLQRSGIRNKPGVP